MIVSLYDENKVEELLEYIKIYADSIAGDEEGDKKEKRALDLLKYLEKNKEYLVSYMDRKIEIPKAPKGIIYKNLGTQENQNCSNITLIVVLDSTSRYSLIRIITIYLSALWLAVLILYVIIMGRFSKRLIRPFIENDEKQKRFITNASHELKTPLAVISSNTEMMETLGGKTKWTDSTRRQVGKLQNLIEDLVVLSRLDEMKEAVLEKTDLSLLTNEIVESFRSVIEDSGIKLVTDIDTGIYAMSEKRSFQQLVSILMDNASKYCDKEGEIYVSLSARNRGKGARLTVSNTYAEGKDVDYSRFFERFYREDTSHNSAKAGFGIGLSMGREIAERLGGKLKAGYNGDIISFEVSL